MRLRIPSRLLAGAASLALVAGVGIAGTAPAVATPSGTTVTPLRTLNGAGTGLDGPGGIAFDSAGLMYVSNVYGNSVTVYARNWATGDTAPIRTLKGAATGLAGPGGIAFDSAGLMYVVNSGIKLSPTLGIVSGSVTVYAKNWANGNTAPIKTLKGAATGLSVPSGLAFDARGNMAVINTGVTIPTNAPLPALSPLNGGTTGNPSVTTYAAGWRSGNTAPIKTLKGAATGLAISMGGIAFDSAGQLHVVNSLSDLTNTQGSSVTVYAANYAGGNTAPVKTLVGPNTRLALGLGLAFDAAGRMLIPDAGSQSILVFNRGWRSGDTAPSGSINTASTAPPNGLTAPGGIAIDARGVLYVTNPLQADSGVASVVALPGPLVPAYAPRNLKAVRTTVGVGTLGDLRGPNIRLSWSAAPARNTPVTGYAATCVTPGKVLRATVRASQTSVILVGAGSARYTCSVVSLSAGGRSVPAVVKKV